MKKQQPESFSAHRHRKKEHRGNVCLLCFLSVVVSSSCILYYCSFSGMRSQESSPGETAAAGASPIGALWEPYIELFSYIVKPGDTFAGILSRYNIQGIQAASLYSALKSTGFSTLFPGDSVVVVKDRDETVKTVSLVSRLSYWYHVYISDTALHAEKKTVDVTLGRCVLKGVLTSSLSEDMFRHGIGDALVIKFADIFAWDINFFMDPRKGDVFEVLFEKKYREGKLNGYGDILAAKYVNRGKPFYAVGLRNDKGELEYFDLDGKSVQKQFLRAPLRFNRISSGFSHRRKHPVLGIYRPHLGIDYAAPRGTPVYAAADGVVTFSGVMGDYGNHIRISHGASYETYYGHLNRIHHGIKKGVRVSQGQFIGAVGSTGLATGPHLDYRMKSGSRFVNPLTVSAPARESVSPGERARFAQVKNECLHTLEQCGTSEGLFVLDIPAETRPNQTLTQESSDGNPDRS